jgi:putative membrane-bound dehydrogenase-like protein
MRLFGVVFILLFGLFFSCQTDSKKNSRSGPRKIEILFLGHSSEHHNSAAYLPLLAAALSKDAINFSYTEDPDDLNKENLENFDGLVIYANHENIRPSQEEALLNFVKEGKGFVPLHCASYCFQNSTAYIDLVGGQFQKHDTSTFVANILHKEHPAMEAVDTFSTWDETYVHHKLTDDRTVLMERVEGDHHEPWTWVKEYGKGRVFYTAYGHDDRTWNNPGFQQLVRQGILWAVGDKVRSQWTAFSKDLPHLSYKPEANIPNYEKRNPPPQYQEPLTPEESAKLIQVPPGFDLELFASEPDIVNPIAMDWDERGRLWVIETVDYPNTVRDAEGEGDDRIKICEDTDGDGKADKFIIFADKLNIPTSLAFVNGGIIVSQAPLFLFLKDTNGDDKADVRETILDGWGTFDTHAGPSNLKYGFDNHIWGVVGYSGFEGTIGGVSQKFDQGLYRFAPDGSDFEFLSKTSNNTWGLGFNENNDVFASTANNTHSVFMGITDKTAGGVEGITIGSEKIDGHYAMHPITDKVRQVDVFGGFTAASGHNFYTARNYPKAFWNKVAFVTEPTGHLVHMARIEKAGAGYAEKDGWNLFASSDEWVAPVEAKVGPDGAVWVLDWYSFIVQHNPTPNPERGGYQAINGPGNAYENPLRDKTHGRIWRVVSRDARPAELSELTADKPKELVKALRHDNLFWRMTAQRLLVERKNRDVLPSLYALIRNSDADDNGENFAATHALWVLEGLRVIKSGNEAFQVVTAALKHPAAGVRKAAIRILSHIQWTEQEVLESGLLNDADPGTRLAAILSLVELAPSDAVGYTLYNISKEASVKKDPWLSKAVYVAAYKHRAGFLSAFEKENPRYRQQHKTSEKKREAAALDDGGWKAMDLPQYIEKAGLNIDGVVWFRRSVNLSSTGKATLSLGPINDSDQTWINGIKVGATEKQYNKPRVYSVTAGTLKSGKNVIAIRVDDTGNNGGIYGKPEEMFIQTGTKKISLAGEWKYEVEKQYNADPREIFKDASIAETFANTYLTGAVVAGSAGEDVPMAAVAKGTTVIHLKAVENAIKFDLKGFAVEAGKPVQIIFTNPDFMQHNLVVANPGTLETVGKAADKLASEANGADLGYVPRIPEVLFHTRLVNPQETVTLEFIAPAQVGDYPYVCTFPGHWSGMNGIMKVVKRKTAL